MSDFFDGGNPQREGHQKALKNAITFFSFSRKNNVRPSSNNFGGVHYYINEIPINLRVAINGPKWQARQPETLDLKVALELYTDAKAKEPGWLFYSSAVYLQVYLGPLGVILQFPMEPLRAGLKAALDNGKAARESREQGERLYAYHYSQERKRQNGEPYKALAWMVHLWEIMNWPNMTCYYYDLVNPQASRKLDFVNTPAFVEDRIKARLAAETQGAMFDPFITGPVAAQPVQAPAQAQRPAPHAATTPPPALVNNTVNLKRFDIGGSDHGMIIGGVWQTGDGWAIPLDQQQWPIQSKSKMSDLNLEPRGLIAAVMRGDIRTHRSFLRRAASADVAAALIKDGLIKKGRVVIGNQSVEVVWPAPKLRQAVPAAV